MRSSKSRLAVAFALVAGGAVTSAATVAASEERRRPPDPTIAHAVLHDVEGNEQGSVQFVQLDNGVLVTVQATGLTPGWHGTHVHAVGDCTVGDPASPFAGAGSHLGERGGHGTDAHDGDLPPLWVNQDGEGHAATLTDNLTVAQLFDRDGAAVIVHSDRDNLAHIPDGYRMAADRDTRNTGDAGARQRCGEVERGLSPTSWGIGGLMDPGDFPLGFAGARLHDVEGNEHGSVQFVQLERGVMVTVQASGLTPGWHGTHVHAVGNCTVDDPDNPFTGAGPHLGEPLGHGTDAHDGDLPPLWVNQDGTGLAATITDNLHLAGVLDADGAAVIVHSGPDNLAHIPERYGEATDTTRNTGDAGSRQRCGVVRGVLWSSLWGSMN